MPRFDIPELNQDCENILYPPVEYGEKLDTTDAENPVRTDAFCVYPLVIDADSVAHTIKKLSKNKR